MVQRLGFFGCESLLKVHPSIRELQGLYALDLRECTRLKELPESNGQLTILRHLYLFSCVERPPEPMKQWAYLGYLALGHCSYLRRLPKQLGDMKGLEFLDASYTLIEELPDSITQLKGLIELDLSSCKKLRKLPEEIGNMEGLEKFIATNTSIEQLPDSFVCLINLEILNLSYCKNLRNLPNSIWKLKLVKLLNLKKCSMLERLPNELGKMECLEYLDASYTEIEQVPDSIELLTRLQLFAVRSCKKLKYVPTSVWNLASLKYLSLLQLNSGGSINFPDTVKNTKLVSLCLECDIILWLPSILSFSSLKNLILRDEGDSLSSTRPFSLSKLYNLQRLELFRLNRAGASFPELPPNLLHLALYEHATLVHLPDLSSLKQLKQLDIVGYHSLESLPPLPPHLQSLAVYDCTSLQDPSDMSMLKELVSLSFGRSLPNLESVSLKQSYLQVCCCLRRQFLSNSAEWFRYKSSGHTLSFDIPLLGDNFLGLALWVSFICEDCNSFEISAVVTNTTNGIAKSFGIPAFCNGDAVYYYVVRCISGDEISITSGDRIKISFPRQLYVDGVGYEIPFEMKMEMCGAHVIQKSPSTRDFPSFFNNIIDRA